MGAACGCMSKKESGGKNPIKYNDSPSRSKNIITNKGGVVVGGSEASTGPNNAASDNLVSIYFNN